MRRVFSTIRAPWPPPDPGRVTAALRTMRVELAVRLLRQLGYLAEANRVERNESDSDRNDRVRRL